jgi:tRNA-specific adenosine deaminase 1
VTTLLIDPGNLYLDTLTLPQSQYIDESIIRAFSSSGRMQSLCRNSFPAPYRFLPFKLLTTDREFHYSRRTLEQHQLTTSNKTIVWTPAFVEILNNGCLQGRKTSDPKGASQISRRNLWSSSISSIEDNRFAVGDLYSTVKADNALKARREVKATVISALSGWIPNHGDESFTLNVLTVGTTNTQSK